MKIERLNNEHIPALVQMEQVCFGACAWTKEHFSAEIENPNALFYVALEANEPVGCIAAQVAFEDGFITKVMVLPAYRRKGIAAALLANLQECAKPKQLTQLSLEVRQSNEAAVLLYTSAGFKTIGKRRNFYRFPKEDAVIMTKNL